MECHYLKNVVWKIKHAWGKRNEKKTGICISWKGELFLEYGSCSSLQRQSAVLPKGSMTSSTTQKIPLFHTQDAKRQDCLADHLLILRILWIYLFWMCYFSQKKEKGSETTRDIMNWFFSVKVSSVLLNYSVSYSSKSWGLADNKWLTL